MPLYIAAHEEAAAVGAALLAAVTMGDFESLEAATQRLHYRRAVEPSLSGNSGEETS
jgi:ribulose kinase